MFAKKNVVNPKAILGTWLVMNWKSTCSGPTSNILKAPKSNFHAIAGSLLEMYTKYTSFKNVKKVPITDYDHVFYNKLHLNIKWPEDLEMYDPCIVKK